MSIEQEYRSRIGGLQPIFGGFGEPDWIDYYVKGIFFGKFKKSPGQKACEINVCSSST